MKRILLVEDDPVDVRLLRIGLQQAGLAAEVETAALLSEAIERLSADPPVDVVLLDLGLPDAAGLAGLQHLLEAFPSLPVVVLTGHDDDDAAKAALRRGAQDYLVKGTADGVVVARTLRYAVERQHLRQAIARQAALRASVQGVITHALQSDGTARDVADAAASVILEGLSTTAIGVVVRLDSAVGQAGAALDRPGITLPITVGEDGRGGIRIVTGSRALSRDEFDVLDAAADTLSAWLVRQDALETVREREAHLRGLFEHARDAILLSNDRGAYVAANPAAAALVGVPTDALVGMSIHDLVDAPAVEIDQGLRAFRDAGELKGDLTLRRPDGTEVEVEFTSVANIVPGVDLSILRDTSERRTQQAALAASEERFRHMAESAQDAIFRIRVRPQPVVEFVNSAVQDMIGFTRSQVLEQPDLLLRRVHPDDRGRLLGTLGESVQLRFQHADGQWRWAEVTQTAVVEAGVVVGAQGLARDVTAQRQLEQSLRRALETERESRRQLGAVNDFKTQLLQAVSHELRTPLTSVLGFVTTLVDSSDRLERGQVEQLLERTLENARRLQMHLDDLQQVDPSRSDDIVLHRERVDLAALVAEEVEAIDLGDRTCRVTVDPGSVSLDSSKTRRIVRALLSNAVKHTPADSHIEIEARIDALAASIQVSDDGPGIPEEERAWTFAPFRRGADALSMPSPGTGVSLALVRRFALMHGGRAGVGETPEGRTVFTVTLPLPTASGAVIPASTSAVDSDGVEAFLDHVYRGSPHQAVELVQTARREGASITQIIQSLLLPIERSIGERWHAGHASVLQEHKVTSAVQRTLQVLTVEASSDGPFDGRVALVAPPGERHHLPGHFAAAILADSGWDVSFYDPDLPLEELRAGLFDQQPLGVLISATNPLALDGVPPLVELAADLGLGTIAGGAALGANSHRAATLGIDAHAPDVTVADQILRQWLATGPPTHVPRVDWTGVDVERDQLTANRQHLLSRALRTVSAAAPNLADHRALDTVEVLLDALGIALLVDDPTIIGEQIALLTRPAATTGPHARERLTGARDALTIAIADLDLPAALSLLHRADVAAGHPRQ